jgi:hypothetical protein
MCVDVWLLIDFATAVCNTIGLYVTGGVGPEDILEKLRK